MVVSIIVVVVAAATFVVVIMDGCRASFEILLRVRYFFFGSSTNFADLDLKFNGLSRKRMIRIDDECVGENLDDAHGHRIAVGSLCDEFIPEGNILASFEVGLVYLEDPVLVMLPERIVRRHGNVAPFSGVHARQSALEARNDLRVTVDVLQRFRRRRTIRRVAVFVEKNIRQCHMRVGTDGERRHEDRGCATAPGRLQVNARRLPVT